MMRLVLMLIAAASVFIASPSNAAIDPFEGIPHATIEVHGKSYTFPIGQDMSGRDRSNDVYMLKKALKGDTDALEIFLEGKPSREFFIGRENPKWLIVTKDEFQVIEY